MANLINFESSWEKAKQKQQLKEARENILAKAKARHEREELKKEEARRRGEGTWMLPTLTDRLEYESQEHGKSKKKKKEKKKKKKKEKKSKRKRKDTSSDSDSESSTKEEWVEAQSAAQVKGPQLQRDSWMTAAPDVFPSVSREDLRQRNRRSETPPETRPEDQMGQHSRELNPYWKEGGTGLPEEEGKKDSDAAAIGDFGVGWLRKAYKRCQQEAEDHGRSLEDVASERYGSLEKLEAMVADAEEKLRQSQRDRDKQGNDRDRDQRRHAERHRGYHRDKHSNRYDDYSSDKYRTDRSRSSSERYKHYSQSHSGADQSRYDHRRSPKRERQEQDRKFSSLRGRFMKPCDGEDAESRGMKTPHSHAQKSDHTPSWRKKGFVKPGDETRSMEVSDVVKMKAALVHSALKDQNKGEKTSRNNRAQDSSTSSSSSSESDESISSDVTESRDEPHEVIMTEQEMNEIGAKIVRAELMGDMDLAQQLKDKLEKARVAHSNQPSAAAAKNATSAKKEVDNEVVLTRTDRRGISRPVTASHDAGHGAGRKRKAKVKTHGKSGERERYFADDDEHSLKSMLAREKLGTTEDSNLQFARLAGRVKGDVDEDELDDRLLERASNKDTTAAVDSRDKMHAINEHKKMTSAMEKCQYCFENVAKHLIIAIGFKVYLCVPHHRSMAEGHCLIVPMQHTPQGTVLDEEVWHEIQVFRKGLTAMFNSRDEDCVFMETSMRLRHFPHMVMECVPLPRDLGDMAPIYFKKAIMESESEWAQNKKLVDLSKSNVRKAVPRGFPYFSVDFGLQGGFAHVIEDEKNFPYYFGREILGGMLDLEPTLWRKPHRENFEAQRVKVLQFANMWKPYDWTERLKMKMSKGSEGECVEGEGSKEKTDGTAAATQDYPPDSDSSDGMSE